MGHGGGLHHQGGGQGHVGVLGHDGIFEGEFRDFGDMVSEAIVEDCGGGFHGHVGARATLLYKGVCGVVFCDCLRSITRVTWRRKGKQLRIWNAHFLFISIRHGEILVR